MEIHDQLCDSVNLLNGIYAFQLLLVVTQTFVFCVFSFFSAYRTTYLEAESRVLAYVNIFWVFYYVVILFTVLSASVKCVNAAKFTGTQVHKVINKIVSYADLQIIQKLSVISHQLKMRKPTLSCGFFNFDFTLLFSVC